MLIAVLVVLGLCLGSFVNALVFRLHTQSKGSTKDKVRGAKKQQAELSIVNGRSICVHCGHELAWQDLVPVFSWLLLRGKCRYCKKPISAQYPAVELTTAALFVLSYILWPGGEYSVNFIIWLIMLTGFMALFVYDMRWMLLPNRIVYPLMALAAALALFNALTADNTSQALYNTLMSATIGGGLFYLLFQFSKGRWIGGGDVKLGFLLGLVLADPYKAFLALMAASTLGTLVVLPALLSKRLKSNSRIPFGPFLLVATVLAMLFGQGLIDWYKGLIGL